MKNERILVVDDETQIRFSLFMLRREAGWRVRTVQVGWEEVIRLSNL